MCRRWEKSSLIVKLALIEFLLLVTASSAQIVVDFEDGSLDSWEIVDEDPQNLGDFAGGPGPSTWHVRDSQLGLDGNVLYQGSNIWGSPGDSMLMGTIIYYADQTFSDFRLEVDVASEDNDAMGLVWGYNGLDDHYRVMMINDVWPEFALDGFNGPMMISHKRISNEEPWYDLLDVNVDDYFPYPQGQDEILRWTLEVVDGNFTFTAIDPLGDEIGTVSGSDDTYSSGHVGIQLYAHQAEFDNFTIIPIGASQLQAGDADQDLKFDQIDLVRVQVSGTYLTGQPATWGEGDWNGAPGGQPGDPPVGNGVFDQVDIIAALNAATYLTGPYASIVGNGQRDDGQTSIIYDPATGELAVDAPAGVELTSINIDSMASIFTGDSATNLGGSFDNDADNNIFKATFGSSFGSLRFGNVAKAGLSQEFVRNDLTVIGSLAGGGDLGEVDLIYVPEPGSIGMLVVGILLGLQCCRRGTPQ